MRKLLIAAGLLSLGYLAGRKVAAQAKPRYFIINGLAECPSMPTSTSQLSDCYVPGRNTVLVVAADGTLSVQTPQ